jgi:cation:H+ antiporter
MSILTWFGIFVASLCVLILAARFFTRSAESIGVALGMSSFATGVIIVAIGTSLPELISSVIAVSKGSSEIVSGNVIGSSISNLFFVLALTAILAPASIRLGEQYIFIDLHFLIGSAFLLALTAWDGQVSRLEALLLLAGYLIYTVHLLKEGKPASDPGDPSTEKARRSPVQGKDLLIVGVSAVFIFLGANYTITSLEVIAGSLGISKSVISVTLLSLGTTLPESVVSITAARQGKADIAVGNILGSCIFNAMAVTGIASLIDPVSFPEELKTLPLPLYLIGVVFFYLLTQDKKISPWEGLLFLLFYIFFILKMGGMA